MASAGLAAAFGGLAGGGTGFSFFASLAAAVGGSIGGVIDNQFLIPLLTRERRGVPQYGDIPIQGFTEGEPIPEAWGAYCMVPGQLIFAGPARYVVKSGSTKRRVPTSYSIRRTVGWVLAHPGPVQDTLNPVGSGFREIYADGRIIFQGAPKLPTGGNIADYPIDISRFSATSLGPGKGVAHRIDQWVMRITQPADAVFKFREYRPGDLVFVQISGVGPTEYSYKRAFLTGQIPPQTDQNQQVPWRVIDSGRNPDGTYYLEIDLRDYAEKLLFQGLPRVGPEEAGIPPFTWPIPAGSIVRVAPEDNNRRWLSSLFADPVNDVQFFQGYEPIGLQPFSSHLQSAASNPEEVTRLPGTTYFVGRDMNISAVGNRIPNISAWLNFADPASNNGNYTTSEFVADVLGNRCGLPASRYDVSALDTYRTANPNIDFGWLDGYVSVGIQSAADLMRPVLLSKEVYLQEHDGQVVARHTPQRSWYRCTRDDLVISPYGEPPIERVEHKEINEALLAQSISLVFRSIDDFLGERVEEADDSGLVSWNRAKIEKQLDFAEVSMTRDEGKAIVNRALAVVRARRYSVGFTLTNEFENVVAEDILVFEDMLGDGETWPILVTQAVIGLDETIQIQGFAILQDGNADNLNLTLAGTQDNETSYDPTADGEGRFGTGRPETLFSRRERLFSGTGMTVVPIDLASFHDDHAGSPGYYLAVTATSINDQLDPNREVWLKRTHDPEYRLVTSGIEESRVGYAETVLPGADPAIFAPRSEVTVNLPTDVQLESVTMDELTDGANRILIGSEIVGFLTATALGDGRWTLTGMLHGLYTTASAVGNHEASETVVVLGHHADAPWTLIHVPINQYDIGTTHLLKALPSGEILDNVPSFEHLVEGSTGRPAEVTPPLVRRLSNGGIEISWIKQNRRVSWGGRDGRPLGPCECDAEFVVTVAEAPTREWVTTESKVIYTVAEQTADGVFGSTVTFSVLEKSQGAGEGPPVEAVIS